MPNSVFLRSTMKLFSVQLRSPYVRTLSYGCLFESSKPLLSFITRVFPPSYNRAHSSTRKLKPKNPILFDYLIKTLNFPKTKALEISSRHAKSTEKPDSVVQFFKGLGLPDAQIKSIVQRQPPILFMDVDKTLKPKVAIFQQLGLSRKELGAFIYENIKVLYLKLENLNPFISLITKILKHDGCGKSDKKVNEDVVRIITRCSGLLYIKTFESNISYLDSSGISGAQLSSLLVSQPQLFNERTEKVKEVVSRALDMGFAMDSEMFVRGVRNSSKIISSNVEKKYDALQSLGFSRSECTAMFQSYPYLLGITEEKIKSGMEFLLHKLLLDKSLVKNQASLSLSMEERVIPRYRVIEVLKSKRLIEKEPYISDVLKLSNENFVEQFISKFVDYAEELMAAYEGRLSESSKQ